MKTEWEKEMMKFTKAELFAEFGVSGDGMLKIEQIRKIKIDLDNKKKVKPLYTKEGV